MFKFRALRSSSDEAFQDLGPRPYLEGQGKLGRRLMT